MSLNFAGTVPAGTGAGFAVRAAELESLVAEVTSPRDGLCVRTITGDPWSGKTWLVDALRDRLRAAGWTVLAARAVAGSSLPYQVFVDLLDDEMTRLADRVRDRLGVRQAGLLSLVLPAWAQGVRSVHADRSATGETVNYRVFRSLGLALEAISTPPGLLLVIDDAHLMDGASVALLDHLRRHPPAAPVVILLAYRPRQTDARLTELLRGPGGSTTDTLHLGPVAADRLARLLPAGVGQIESQALIRLSAGNPGVLTALASVTASEAGHRGRPDIADLTDGTPPAMPDAPAYDLEPLSALARVVARAGSVAGDPFGFAALEAIAQICARDALAGVDELLAHDIVRPAGSWGRFVFRDVAIRSVVYHSMSGVWRHGAHNRALVMLRKRSASATVLANHLQHVARADDPEAVAVLAEAGRHCMFTAPARAARWLEVACGEQRAAPDVLVLFGQSLAITGRFDESDEVLSGLIEDGNRPAPAVLAVAAEWSARLRRLSGRHEQAADLVHDTLAELTGKIDTTALRLELVAIVADSAATTVAPALRAHLLRAANHSDRWLRLRSQALLAVLTDGDTRVRHVGQAARLLGEFRSQDRLSALDSWYWLAEAHRRMGALDEAAAEFHAALVVAHSVGQEHLRAHLGSGLSRTLLGLGDNEQAATWTVYSREAARSLTDARAVLRVPGRFEELRRAVGAVEGMVPNQIGPAHAGRRVALTVMPTRPAPGPAGKLDTLSRRELQIAEQVSMGHTNQRIASSLRLSHKTVETYLDRIFKKLAVTSRVQIAYLMGSAGREVR